MSAEQHVAHEHEEQEGRKKVAVADLLPQPVRIPPKRSAFHTSQCIAYFFADVIRVKKLSSRPIIGRPKARRVLMLTATRLYLCHPKTAEVSVEQPVDTIRGAVLIGEGDIGLLIDGSQDLLISTPHDLVRSKFIAVLKQLLYAKNGNQYPLITYTLKPDVELKDVLNLEGTESLRYHPFVNVVHEDPPAPPPCSPTSSSSSSSLPPPSGSPSGSPSSRRSGRSANSRVFDGYTEADHDYDRLADRCHELEDIIGELRGEIHYLRDELHHFQQIREDGAYNTELLRQHFENEKTLALQEQVRQLSGKVAMLESENASLRMTCEDRSMSPSSALLSRQATQFRGHSGHSHSGYFPSREWTPDVRVTSLEAQFDSEVLQMRRAMAS